jgi:hypothetical protein
MPTCIVTLHWLRPLPLHGQTKKLYYQATLGIYVEDHLHLESYALAVVMHGTLELN